MTHAKNTVLCYTSSHHVVQFRRIKKKIDIKFSVYSSLGVYMKLKSNMMPDSYLGPSSKLFRYFPL